MNECGCKGITPDICLSLYTSLNISIIRKPLLEFDYISLLHTLHSRPPSFLSEPVMKPAKQPHINLPFVPVADSAH